MLELMIGIGETSQNGKGWVKLPNPPRGGYDVRGGVINNVLYIYGPSGTNKLLAYDIDAQTWSYKANGPTARSGFACAVLDGYLYLSGGTTNGTASGAFSDLWRYDPTTDTWSQRYSDDRVRYNHGLVAYNGMLYQTMGRGVGGALLDFTMRRYDPINNRWWTFGNTPGSLKATEHHTVIAHATHIYYIGGFSAAGPTGNVYRFGAGDGGYWNNTLPEAINPMGVFQRVPGGKVGQIFYLLKDAEVWSYNVATNGMLRLADAPVSFAQGCVVEGDGALYAYSNSLEGMHLYRFTP